jgi:flagellin
VDRIANVTNFNGTPLLNGQAPKGELQFQVGTRNDRHDQIVFSSQDNDVRASNLGIDSLNYSNIDDARDAIDKVDKGLSHVSETRARLGAIQNRLQSTVNNLGTTKENLSAARSRIADTDVATETSELVRSNILQQAGVAVLAQANQTPMSALKLIG